MILLYQHIWRLLTMMNNNEMVAHILESYSNIRFDLMFHAWFFKAKERIPEISDIKEVFFPEDLGCSLVSCDCNDSSHRIRFLYKITKADGTEFRCGSRCLQTKGYPNSLGNRLDKLRRIIQRDIETIEPLEPDTARSITNIYQTWAQTIIDNKYYPGLLFLEKFGSVLNGFVECGFALPQWLRVMLKRFCMFAVKEAPILKAKLLKENREKYKEIFEYLSDLDKNVIFGRSPWIKELLDTIDSGGKLLPWQINKINDLKNSEKDQGIITRTEKALPFLIALTNGSIPITKYDATPAAGQKDPIFLSYLKHTQKQVALTSKQLSALKWKCKKFYMQSINKLPAIVKQTTAALIARAKTLPEDDPQLIQIKTILLERNVDLNHIQG